jgi:CheY-like chemotaxis protein
MTKSEYKKDLNVKRIKMTRILAVDDDKDILDILQFILEDSGYEVDTLADGRLIFDRIKETNQT